MVAAAVLIGLASGFMSIGFREAIGFVQYLGFGFMAEDAWRLVAELPWYVILGVPTAGGLLVGLYLRWTMPGGRPVGVAQVMEASALGGGRMSLKTGMHGAVANILSLGAGASAGREGPVVHLGATVGASVAEALHLPPGGARILLGCGVAAAVAAAFNAPLAGGFFLLGGGLRPYAI
ncbi:MAG: chloride channel protein, partial [Alphaproteobacteria bacterium]